MRDAGDIAAYFGWFVLFMCMGLVIVTAITASLEWHDLHTEALEYGYARYNDGVWEWVVPTEE